MRKASSAGATWDSRICRRSTSAESRKQHQHAELPFLCALLVALVLTGPATLQAACPTPPSGALATPGAGLDFFANFVAGGKLATFGYSLPPNNGATSEGDLNSTYYSLYYSIVNAKTDRTARLATS